MKKIFLIIFILCGVYLFTVEKLIFKNNDVFTGNVVLLTSEKVVFYFLTKRFDFKLSDIKKVDFSESDSEFEIILEDNSKIKGAIVDQDDEFWTIGSSAGITPIEKKKVKEIFNPKLSKYRNPEKKFVFKTNIGIEANSIFVINDFSNYFKSYWSVKNYFEVNFFLPVYFGFDVSFIMFYPEFGSFNDFLYFVPVNFTLKYMDSFYKGKKENHPVSNLFWHIKMGAGFTPIIFSEIKENKVTSSLGFSGELDYGIKYYITKFFSLGISGNSSIIVDKSQFIFLQGAGIITEFKF